MIEHIVDMAMELQQRDNTNLPVLKKELDETQKAIDNMLWVIQQGILTTSTKQCLITLQIW